MTQEFAVGKELESGDVVIAYGYYTDDIMGVLTMVPIWRRRNVTKKERDQSNYRVMLIDLNTGAVNNIGEEMNIVPATELYNDTVGVH